MITWLWENRELVWGLTLDHARLSAIPILIGLIASVPLGWLANYNRFARSFLLSLGGVLFTIPSLALFIALPAITGWQILDERNIITALTIYAVAILVRGAADAFASVPAPVLDSSTAIGFSRFSRFLTVELPLAGPVLMASLRVVSVSTVSLVSVGELIGVQSLGTLFRDGYQRSFPDEIIIGIVLSVLVAVVFDRIIVLVGRALMPWTRALPSARKRPFIATPMASGVRA